METPLKRLVVLSVFLLLTAAFFPGPILQVQANISSLELGSFQPIERIQEQIQFTLPGTIFGEKSITIKEKKIQKGDGKIFPPGRLELVVAEEIYPLSYEPQKILLPENEGEGMVFKLQFTLLPADKPGNYQGEMVIGEIEIPFSVQITPWTRIQLKEKEHIIRLPNWSKRQIMSEFPLQINVAANTPWILEGLLEKKSTLHNDLLIIIPPDQKNHFQVHYPQGISLQESPTLLLSGKPTTGGEKYWIPIYLGFIIHDFTHIPAGSNSSFLSFQVSPH